MVQRGQPLGPWLLLVGVAGNAIAAVSSGNSWPCAAMRLHPLLLLLLLLLVVLVVVAAIRCMPCCC